MSRHHQLFTPRLLGLSAAAGYLGISPSKLRTLPIPRKVDGGNRLYERADLDAYADGLAYEGEDTGAEQICDEMFGRGSA